MKILWKLLPKMLPVFFGKILSGADLGWSKYTTEGIPLWYYSRGLLHGLKIINCYQSYFRRDVLNITVWPISDDSKYISFPTSSARKQQEPYDHMKDAAFFYDAAEQFKKGMKLDPHVKGNYEVTTISKVTITFSLIIQ